MKNKEPKAGTVKIQQDLAPDCMHEFERRSTPPLITKYNGFEMAGKITTYDKCIKCNGITNVQKNVPFTLELNG